MADTATDGNRRLLNRTGAGVAGALMLILGLSIVALMLAEIPEKNHDIILILVTTVANAILAIVSYFFGTSLGNTQQRDIMATQATTAAKIADTAAVVARGASGADKTMNVDPGQTATVHANEPPAP